MITFNYQIIETSNKVLYRIPINKYAPHWVRLYTQNTCKYRCELSDHYRRSVDDVENKNSAYQHHETIYNALTLELKSIYELRFI